MSSFDFYYLIQLLHTKSDIDIVEKSTQHTIIKNGVQTCVVQKTIDMNFNKVSISYNLINNVEILTITTGVDINIINNNGLITYTINNIHNNYKSVTYTKINEMWNGNISDDDMYQIILNL